jgi:asparagine synthase (glutamine-hydrolysing)
VGFEDDPSSNELPFARVVAQRFDTEHHEFILKPDDFFDGVDLLLHHAEEPVVESAAVALLRLSQMAREYVTVVLSGEGADEVFAGYPLYGINRAIERLRPFSGLLGVPPLAGIAGRLADTEKKQKYLDWLTMPFARRYRTISNDVTPRIRDRMYTDGLKASVGDRLDAYYTDLLGRAAGLTGLGRMTYADIKTWLPDDLLLKADKMTMAASLEMRVPFLDHHVIEFGLGLPDRLKIQGKRRKFLLKQVAERYLPREIVHRSKKGFPLPLRRWFQTDLHAKAREVILDPRSVGRGYFRPEYLEGVLARHREGREDLSRRILTLLILELWHRKYVDG